MRHGVTRDEDGLRLAVWAPKAERLQLRLGERLLPLAPAPDGWWTAELPRLPPGTPYAVLFPDGRVRPDPAAREQVGDVHGPSALFDPGEFRWTDGGWQGVPLEALVFYEMHVGTFTGEGTLDAAAARLPDLVDLGITCVELMPLQPFAGARNWGYDGVLLHAVHGAYGGPAALQRFVDRAQALGLGVCLDVVYNHLGPEGNYLGEFGPYTTSRHHSPWGDGMNYDGPDSGPVRAYMVQAARSWVEDFHVDALRLDAVHAIVDDGEVHLVQDIVRAVHETSGGRAQVIAESDLNDRRVVDPPPGGWGCDAAWADDFHHAVHALLTDERGAFYADFGDPDDLLQALEPLATLLLLGPGLPLLFMGEEYGETRPFLYFTSHGDPELARAVSEGRRREFIARATEVPDPQAEETFRASRPTWTGGEALRDHYRRMLELRRRHQTRIGTHWPRVRREGRAYRLERPGLTVTVNLGPEPALGMPGWGWEVSPR